MAKYTPKTIEELRYLVQNESIYLGDIDTSNIMDMFQLFARSKRRDFSGIDSWDTSKVVDMTWMFLNAKSFNENINSWDTSNVVSMRGMFKGAKSFNQPLDKWDTSNVINMVEMFNGAKSFNQNIDSWNVSNVKVNEIESISGGFEDDMFQDSNMENLPIWFSSKKMDWSDLENITNTSISKSIIRYIEKDTQSNKYVPKAKKELWALCYDETISLGSIDTSNIVDMSSLFYGSDRRNFSGIDSWDTSSVVNMSSMFHGHKSFNEPLDKWDTSSVEFMTRMFFGAESFNQNIDSWNVSSVRDNKEMFWDSGVSKLPKWYKKREIAGNASNLIRTVENRVAEVIMNPRPKKPKIAPQSNKANDWSKIFGSSSQPALTKKSIFRIIGATLFFVILVAVAINFDSIQNTIRNNSKATTKPKQTQTTQQKQTQPAKQPAQNILRCDNKDLLNHLIKITKEGVKDYITSQPQYWEDIQLRGKKAGLNLTSIDAFVESVKFNIMYVNTKLHDESNQKIICEARIVRITPIDPNKQVHFVVDYSAWVGNNGNQFKVLDLRKVDK